MEKNIQRAAAQAPQGLGDHIIRSRVGAPCDVPETLLQSTLGGPKELREFLSLLAAPYLAEQWFPKMSCPNAQNL